MFGNKAANRVSQFTMQGLLSRPSEQAARWTVFSRLTDFYRDMGYSKQDAFNLAREKTENFMVDYSSDAKARVWKDMGFVGSLAGRLQTYATANFSQGYILGKQAVKGGAHDKAAFIGYLATLGALGGVAGLPLGDFFMEMTDWFMSREGKQFSTRNYIRNATNNYGTDGLWAATPYGLAPSFGSRSINTDTGLPAFVGLPAFGKVPEMARTIGRRVGGKQEWGAETEAEKGREISAFAPNVAQPLVDRAYLSENVGGREHNISGKTGTILHTKTPDEKSFGNIKSIERSIDSSINSEGYNKEKRFLEQKKLQEQELKSLSRDIYIYGNDNAQKTQRLINQYRKFVVDYAGDPSVFEKSIDDIRPYVNDNYLAKFVELVNKKDNVTLEDVRKLRQYKESSDLYKKSVGGK